MACVMVVVITIGLLAPGAHAQCFNNDRQVIDGCACDPSCGGQCGYSSAPNGVKNCLNCPSGKYHNTDKPAIPPVHTYDESGTGACIDPPICYSSPGVENPGCKCHPNCQTCGYGDGKNGEGAASPDDCTSCYDPLYYNAITLGDESHGMCLPSPPGLGLFGSIAPPKGHPPFVLVACMAATALAAVFAVVWRRRQRMARQAPEEKPLNNADTSATHSYGTQATQL